MRLRRVLLYVLASLVAFAVTAFVAFSLSIYIFLHSRCSERTIIKSPSPDGSYEAALLEERCGATMRDMTRVHVEGGALDDFVFIVERKPRISLTWLSPTTLLIANESGSSLSCCRVIRQEEKLGELDIEYLRLGSREDNLQWLSTREPNADQPSGRAPGPEPSQ